MSLTRQITIALKKHLKQKGITYSQLGGHLELSEASVKRLFSASSFTVKRLESICQLLELDFYELAKLARGQSELSAELSESQESALAANPKLLSVFYLLLNGWQPKEIKQQFDINDAELVKLLSHLDHLKLLELHPNNRVKLLTHSTLQWRSNGPIRMRYQAQVTKEFLQAEFKDSSEILRFETRELSQASLAVLKRKATRLMQEFSELAEIDASLPSIERQSVALLLAARPWVFSVFSELKRKSKGT